MFVSDRILCSVQILQVFHVWALHRCRRAKPWDTPCTAAGWEISEHITHLAAHQQSRTHMELWPSSYQTEWQLQGKKNGRLQLHRVRLGKTDKTASVSVSVALYILENRLKSLEHWFRNTFSRALSYIKMKLLTRLAEISSWEFITDRFSLVTKLKEENNNKWSCKWNKLVHSILSI